jgi:hypothetical protein
MELLGFEPTPAPAALLPALAASMVQTIDNRVLEFAQGTPLLWEILNDQWTVALGAAQNPPSDEDSYGYAVWLLHLHPQTGVLDAETMRIGVAALQPAAAAAADPQEGGAIQPNVVG